MSFALPSWALKPEGPVAVIFLVLYIGLFVAGIMYVFHRTKKAEAAHEEKTVGKSVANRDQEYLTKKVSETERAINEAAQALLS